MTKTAPFRRMTLHFSHIGLTEARTFIAPVSYRIQDSRTPHESDGRHNQPTGPTGKDSRGRLPQASGSYPRTDIEPHLPIGRRNCCLGNGEERFRVQTIAFRGDT